MPGRRELAAAAVSALLAVVAVVVLTGLDDGPVVEVRVQAQPPTPDPDISSGQLVWPPAFTCDTAP